MQHMLTIVQYDKQRSQEVTHPLDVADVDVMPDVAVGRNQAWIRDRKVEEDNNTRQPALSKRMSAAAAIDWKEGKSRRPKFPHTSVTEMM